MAQKLYNLDTGVSGNLNPCVVTPDDTDSEVVTSSSQVWEIVVPIYDYLKASWVAADIANPAIVDRVNSRVFLPKLTDGDLASKYFLEKVSDGNSVTDIEFDIIKIEGSISATATASGYVELPFNKSTKQIKKFDDSGVLKIPNYIKFSLQVNPYGDETTSLVFGSDYKFKLKPSLDSEPYSFVNNLSGANEAVSAQV